MPRGISYETQHQLAERADVTMRRYALLSRERRDCVMCSVYSRPGKCGQPHAYPVKTIARELGRSARSVQRDIERCRENWRRWWLAPEIIQEQTEKNLAMLDWIEQEAQAEWERSKLPQTETTTEASSTGVESGAVTGQRNRARKVVKEHTGHEAYLEIVRRVQADKRSLYGLDAPSKKAAVPAGEGDNSDELFRLMNTLAEVALKNVTRPEPIDITPPLQPMSSPLAAMSLAQIVEATLPPPSDDVDAALALLGEDANG